MRLSLSALAVNRDLICKGRWAPLHKSKLQGIVDCQRIHQLLRSGVHCRRIKHYLIVVPEFLEEVPRVLPGSVHCVNNLSDG